MHASAVLSQALLPRAATSSAPRRPRAAAAPARSSRALQVRVQQEDQKSSATAAAATVTRRTALAASTLSLVASSGLPDSQSQWSPFTPPAAYALDNPLNLENGYIRYFGQATSASSYGGYGGNEEATDLSQFKYWFDVPKNWKGDIVTKQEKGYLGIDARFSNPAAPKKNKAYVITFPGYAKLKDDYEEILNDLALADPDLQDSIANADSFTFTERKLEDGQIFVDYDVISYPTSVLASITTYNKRLFAILAFSDADRFEERRAQMDVTRKSLECIKKSKEELQNDLTYFKRGAMTCTMGEC